MGEDDISHKAEVLVIQPIYFEPEIPSGYYTFNLKSKLSYLPHLLKDFSAATNLSAARRAVMSREKDEDQNSGKDCWL